MTLSSANCMHTCMNTIPSPTHCMVIKWRVQLTYSVIFSVTTLPTACQVSTALVFTWMWPEVRCPEPQDDQNNQKLCLCDKYQCFSRKFKCLSRIFNFRTRNQNARPRCTTLYKSDIICANYVYALYRGPLDGLDSQ